MTRIGAVVLGAVLLAGCGEAAPSEPMAMAAETKVGKGTGTVTAVDAEAGSVTIEHGAMPEVGWSAMTMTFKADPGLLAGVAEGDMVAFDLTVEDNAGTVTALTKEPSSNSD